MDKNNTFTWDEIYERAIDCGFGHPFLKAKDNARADMAAVIKEKIGINIDECEIPEEEIERFLEKAECDYQFDERGRLRGKNI